jgi:hypothetical protein
VSSCSTHSDCVLGLIVKSVYTSLAVAIIRRRKLKGPPNTGRFTSGVGARPLGYL